jgi:NitT/TauT family transport system ATP-binding protein
LTVQTVATAAHERVAGGAARSAASIAISGVEVTYGVGTPEPVTAIARVDLEVPDGAFVSLVGPSGCGKSTLLMVVADLMAPTRGHLTIGGAAPADLRRAGRIGLVFQQANLMPWLRIADNIRLLRELVEKRGGGAPARAAASVEELIEVVGLSGFETKYPHQLSGGMQQRAAIARALVYESPLLLMDEPFAALDALTREDMNMELLRIWQLTRKSIVFVTHNISEAVLLSDRVIVMTARPGQVKEIIPIDIPRPRSLSLIGDPRFGAYTERIRALFDETRRRKTADIEPQRRSQ